MIYKGCLACFIVGDSRNDLCFTFPGTQTLFTLAAALDHYVCSWTLILFWDCFSASTPPDPSAFIPMFTSQHQTPTTRNCTHWALALDSRLRNDCLPSVCWNNTFFFLEMTHYSYLLGQSWERKVACDPCLDQVDEALHPPSQPTLDKPVNAHAQISHVHQVYYKSLSLLLK